MTDRAIKALPGHRPAHTEQLIHGIEGGAVESCLQVALDIVPVEIAHGPDSRLHQQPPAHQVVEVLARKVARDAHGPGDIDRGEPLNALGIELARHKVQIGQNVFLRLGHGHGRIPFPTDTADNNTTLPFLPLVSIEHLPKAIGRTAQLMPFRSGVTGDTSCHRRVGHGCCDALDNAPIQG